MVVVMFLRPEVIVQDTWISLIRAAVVEGKYVAVVVIGKTTIVPIINAWIMQ